MEPYLRAGCHGCDGLGTTFRKETFSPVCFPPRGYDRGTRFIWLGRHNKEKHVLYWAKLSWKRKGKVTKRKMTVKERL